MAIRYHEIKTKVAYRNIIKKIKTLSVNAVLEKARAILGSVSYPLISQTAPLDEVPYGALEPELDLEQTLENEALFSLHSNKTLLSSNAIWMNYQAHRKQPVVLTLDTSLSMTGEKLALTSVALAVVLLQFPDDPIGIVAFENEAQVLKTPEEKIRIEELVEKFLDVPAQGYTHLESGLKTALGLVSSTKHQGIFKPPSTVLLTDGKYTAGRDPAYLAHRFPHLIVLKMGREKASLDLCRELAKKGHGLLREVGELEVLPMVMYGVVKDLLRGRSVG
ncbi:MAG: VWA domain-containing protein [Bdellovibrio sp.]|nr:VWA domain-containing protein [Bdellovibrio sp.]